MLRLLKQHIKRTLYAARGLKPDLKIPVKTVNPGDQAWYFADGTLEKGDVVYSLGLATNIEFDLNLIRDFGVEVHGFDPTPDSVEWIENQNLPARFHHHAVAVAGHNGELTFELPVKAGECARAVGGVDQKPEVRPQTPDLRSLISERRPSTLPVPCRSISSLMLEMGHERLALLKMDIEGSEYEVIDDILAHQLQIDQILVEFHHRFPEIGISRTIKMKKRLIEAGYLLFHVSPWCEEFAFIQQTKVSNEG